MAIKTKGQLASDLISVLTTGGLLTAIEDRGLRQDLYDSVAGLLGDNIFNGNQDINGVVTITGAGNSNTTNSLHVLNSDSDTILEALDSMQVGVGVTPTENFSVKSNAINEGFNLIGSGNNTIVKVAENGDNSGYLDLKNTAGTTKTHISSATSEASYINSSLNINSNGTNGGLGVVNSGSSVLVGGIFENGDGTGYFKLANAAGTIRASLSVSTSEDSYLNIKNLGIGTATPELSALLELSSTTKCLLLTRMTTTERNAMTPVNGMLIYNTTLNKFQGYEAGAWANLI